MPGGRRPGLNEALEKFYRAACAEAGLTPGAAPVARRIGALDDQGFNWTSSALTGETREQSLQAIAQARAAGWQLP
jgi:hypothetical protein